MKPSPSHSLSTSLLLLALVPPLISRESLAQEEHGASERHQSGALVLHNDEHVALLRIKAGVTDKLGTIEALVNDVERLAAGDRSKWEGHCNKIAALAGEIEHLLDSTAVDSPRSTFAPRTDRELSLLVKDIKLFSRVSDAFFSLHKATFPSKDGLDHRALSGVLSILAKQFSEEILDEYKAGSFQSNLTDLFREGNVQRDLYIYLAKNGPKGGRQGASAYMQWAWAAQMDKDIASDAIFPEIANRSLFSRTPRPMGVYAQGIYGSGFNLVEVVTEMSKSVPVEEPLLSEMWRFATHPSGVNGHVSLSRLTLESLAKIASSNKSNFDPLLDSIDSGWGVTPRSMIERNLVAPNEYSMFTDGKVGGQLDGFKNLGTSLGIRP